MMFFKIYFYLKIHKKRIKKRKELKAILEADQKHPQVSNKLR
jgi:hypothetical protein